MDWSFTNRKENTIALLTHIFLSVSLYVSAIWGSLMKQRTDRKWVSISERDRGIQVERELEKDRGGCMTAEREREINWDCVREKETHTHTFCLLSRQYRSPQWQQEWSHQCHYCHGYTDTQHVCHHVTVYVQNVTCSVVQDACACMNMYHGCVCCHYQFCIDRLNNRQRVTANSWLKSFILVRHWNTGDDMCTATSV